MSVDIGDKVTAGQLLVELNIPELSDELKQKEALVAQAQAEFAQSQAAIAAAEAKVDTSEAKIAESNAGVDRAEANFLRYQDELGRVEELTKTKAVTTKLADETRNAFRAADAGRREAAANVASAKAALAESRSHVEKAKADALAAQARVAVAQANLQFTKTMLGYTEIRAPFAGTITARNVDTGHFIPAGATAALSLLTLSRTDIVRVTVDVPENEATYTHPGDTATLRVPALPNGKFAGKVSRISSALNASNRTLLAEIDVPNSDGKLLPGMYVMAILTVAEQPGALVLPKTAIGGMAEGNAFCFVVEAGKLAKRSIQLGLEAAGQVEVTSGLQGTESVVKSVTPALIEGQPATASEFKAG